MKEINIDNTMLSVFRSCPRKYYYRHHKHLVKEYTASALQYGIAVHEALELYHKSNGGSLSIEEVISITVDKYKKVFDATDESEWRTPEKLKTTLIGYFQKAPLSPVEIDEHKYIEESLSMPFCTIKMPENEYLVNYVFKIDSVVEYMGDLYIQDHKTTSALNGTKAEGKSISEAFWKGMYPHAATMGYLYCFKELIDDKENRIKGVIIDAIGSNKYGNAFERRSFSYMEDQLREWKQGTIITIERLINSFEISGFAQNFDNCCDFGSVCAYHDVCRSPLKLRGQLLENYKIEEWNPLKKENTI